MVEERRPDVERKETTNRMDFLSKIFKGDSGTNSGVNSRVNSRTNSGTNSGTNSRTNSAANSAANSSMKRTALSRFRTRNGNTMRSLSRNLMGGGKKTKKKHH